MSEEYELALNAVREAGAKFDAVTLAYRAGQIGDDEYLAARGEYAKAGKVFDVAFAKEQERGA